MKIVSLLPSTTEICYALGLGDAVVGVTHECDYPEDARTKPHLTANVLPDGEHSSADIDRMIAERVLHGQSIYDLDTDLLAELAPDLILTQELCEVCAVSYTDVLAAAQALPKVPEVAAFEPHNVDEILASIAEVARLAGIPEQGQVVVGELRERLASVAERVANRTQPRVVCLEWLSPPMVGGHWVPEMVALAGGVDVLGRHGEPSRYVTWDEIAAADPDIVIVMPCGYDLDATHLAMRELDAIPEWHGLRAVREGRFYPVDGSGLFNRPGPRIIDGVELLETLFHGTGDAGRGTR